MAALGVFLTLVAVYVSSNVGRIDIIDGQVHYDVAQNWRRTGLPQVTDPWLLHTRYVVRTKSLAYSAYNAAASVTPMPFMVVSRLLPGHSVERDRFLFTMTGPI